uniref:Uncharacterized protein n=1 Tax=Oryza brachyantha TaxID=4533 RepID=J3N8G6_ORYBR
MIGTVDTFEISGLDEKQFWQFFKACVFGNENYEGHPSLQSIGQQIAAALKGCPLAARSVGALLNRNVSYEHWRTVQDKWKSLQIKDDDITRPTSMHFTLCARVDGVSPERDPSAATDLRLLLAARDGRPDEAQRRYDYAQGSHHDLDLDDVD